MRAARVARVSVTARRLHVLSRGVVAACAPSSSSSASAAAPVLFGVSSRGMATAGRLAPRFSLSKTDGAGDAKSDVYEMNESIRLIKAMAVSAAFDQSITMNVHLNVDPRKPNQMVRGLAQLPFGTGKTSIVAVFARGERAFEAKQAGADIVGDQDLADKILAGHIDFTRCIATPDMMPTVSKVARILGPKGLMPNPKTGTVTHNVAEAVKAAKAGQVEFKSDKDGSVRATLGKASFPTANLTANMDAFYRALVAAKPSGAKGVYLKRAFLNATMTAAVELDTRAAPFKGVTAN